MSTFCCTIRVAESCEVISKCNAFLYRLSVIILFCVGEFIWMCVGLWRVCVRMYNGYLLECARILTSLLRSAPWRWSLSPGWPTLHLIRLKRRRSRVEEDARGDQEYKGQERKAVELLLLLLLLLLCVSALVFSVSSQLDCVCLDGRVCVRQYSYS